MRAFKAVTVFDLSAARVAELVAEGATAGASVAEVAKGASVILLSLPTSREVEAVLLASAFKIQIFQIKTNLVSLRRHKRNIKRKIICLEGMQNEFAIIFLSSSSGNI